MLFHRDTRIVPHLLVEAGESIEQRRLTGVRPPHKGHP
jgi:hypothetical protein